MEVDEAIFLLFSWNKGRERAGASNTNLRSTIKNICCPIWFGWKLGGTWKTFLKITLLTVNIIPQDYFSIFFFSFENQMSERCPTLSPPIFVSSLVLIFSLLPSPKCNQNVELSFLFLHTFCFLCSWRKPPPPQKREGERDKGIGVHFPIPIPIFTF